MMNQLFDKTVHLLSRALDLRSTKHQAIISNVANQDTPYYKAKDLNFKEVIRDFLPPPVDTPMFVTNEAHFSLVTRLMQTDPQHIPINGPVYSAESYVYESPDKTARLDQNNVSIDQEMAKMAENNLMFNASSQWISGKFLGLKTAIRGGQ